MAREHGRHERRPPTPAQLHRIAATLTPGQLAAAIRLLIDREPWLARTVIAAAVTECPTDTPPEMIP